MYKIVFPIPVHALPNGDILVPAGLARDVLAQCQFEPSLRLICPRADSPEQVIDAQMIDLAAYPGLSFGLMPWNGYRRTWLSAYRAIKAFLTDEARTAEVWHTACSLSLWDLTTVSYAIGRRHAPGLRVICLDSDPAAMLASGGGIGSLRWRLVRASLRRRARGADAAIFVGRGPLSVYGPFARKSVMTEAVWLADGDLADESQVRRKFAALDPAAPVRIALPSRLTAWKGVDDAIEAIAMLAAEHVPCALDVIGSGEDKRKLEDLAKDRGLDADRVRFLPPVPYGPVFFQLLQSYPLVLAPTRALEETRIIYDAAASGCGLIHSATPTLQSALEGWNPRWTHAPADPASLAAAIRAALAAKDAWLEAALAGLEFVRGRTISDMHRKRSEFLAPLRKSAECKVQSAK